MNLTATMANQPSLFLNQAESTQKWLKNAALTACQRDSDLYFAAREMGLDDTQIVANFFAELAENDA